MTAGNTRRRLIAGNWKLNKNLSEAQTFARELKRALAGTRNAEVAVAPVFTAVNAVAESLAGSGIRTLGQDVYWEDSGAFTGEVSAPLLKDAGAHGCIIGHSERRQFFGEDDASVNKKLKATLAAGLVPVVCIGEQLAEREAGRALAVVLGQLDGALAGLSASALGSLVIAYEPVWAIGTGRTASAQDAQEMHAAIRERVAKTHSPDLAAGMRILYGGSVKPSNAAELLDQADVDGALVGGASLALDSFVAIAQAAG